MNYIVYGIFFYLATAMRQRLICKNFIPFIPIVLFAVIGCNSPNDNGPKTKQTITQNTDSVDYYIAETNSTSGSEYTTNLKKAYSLALKVPNDSLKSRYFSDLSLNYL